MKHHTQLTRPFSPAEEAEEAEMQAGRGAGSAPRGSGAEGGWPAGLPTPSAVAPSASHARFPPLWVLSEAAAARLPLPLSLGHAGCRPSTVGLPGPGSPANQRRSPGQTALTGDALAVPGGLVWGGLDNRLWVSWGGGLDYGESPSPSGRLSHFSMRSMAYTARDEG